MTERFMVDDAGTLIDMVTRDTFDYVSDVVGLLNGYDKENRQLILKLDTHKHPLWSTREAERIVNKLKQENEQLKQTNQRLTIALKEIKEKTNIYLEMTKKGE